MPNHEKMKIIVIDDMMTMRKIIAKMLKEIGFANISEADDGATAWPMIQQAQENGEPFELIVSDLNMPKMNGLDLLGQVRSAESLAHTPFMIVAAENERRELEELGQFQQGATSYIIKPLEPETLRGEIHQLID